MNQLLFVIFPYVAITLALVGTVVRWRTRPFSVSSLSSQLLERRQLFWGSPAFHWGIILILLAHLAVLLVPQGFEAWNRVPLRLYALEITGFALGVWALLGLAILIYRRASNAKIRAVSTRMDWVVLALLVLQIASGLWIAAGYRFGSSWAPSVVVPYIKGLLLLQPKPELVAYGPLALKLHICAFFALLAVFCFSRLPHLLPVPLGYLARPWQLVIEARPRT